MQRAIYQFTLIIGLFTLAILLIRGVSLQQALIRSGLVLVAVLVLLIIAGNILRLSMRPGETEEEPTTESAEQASGDESKGNREAGT